MRLSKTSLFLSLALALALLPATAAHAAEITKIGPATISVGDPDFSLRVTGNDFKSSSVVLLDGQPLTTTFVSKKKLLAYVPISVAAAAGTHNVSVRTDGVATATKPLTVQPASDAVTIVRVNPDALNVITVPVEFEVRVGGSGFKEDSEILVFGAPVPTTRREPGVLAAIVGTSFFNAPALVPFQVRNGTTLSNIFTLAVFGKAAEVDGLTPGTVKVGTGPVEIKIAGNGFSKNALVIVDGVTLTPSEIKPQQIKVTIPASLLDEPAQLAVYVQQETGLSNVAILRVVPSEAPFIYGLSPDRVQAGVEGADIVINGAGFTDKSKVLVNGVEVTTEFAAPGRIQFRLTKAQTTSPATFTVTVRNNSGVTSNSVELAVVTASVVSTVAGKSIDGFEDGTVDEAKFRRPSRIAIGPDGKLYIADQLNHAIRRFTPETGFVETLAGDGVDGYIDSGDSTVEGFTNPRFNNPLGVAVAPNGTIYVADYGNNVIRRMRLQGSAYVVDTVVGANKLIDDKETRETTNSTRQGLSGFQNGAGTVARFRGPDGMVMASDGTLYVADPLNQYVRAVDTHSASFTTTTVAGIGLSGYVDGDVSLARLFRPVDVALSPDEHILYIADFGNRRVRSLDLLGHELSTLSGSGAQGAASGSALVASFFGPLGVTVAPDGIVYATDDLSNTIRRIESSGETTTLAGGGNKTEHRDGIGPVANFKDPRGIVYDTTRSTLFVADQGHQRIRRIEP